MGAMIATEIEDKLLGIPDCERANVEIVWEPPWTPERISEAARKQLGLDNEGTLLCLGDVLGEQYLQLLRNNGGT